ncbi:extracellular solute-binding protein [Sciscionella sediminilitoris]|uniref:extracellular solute-binding protein n=1 Tax=Sciscionella sediminilitoris TaxID=1445613 RepID=UPI0004DF8593|nr:extracellular solute-binding protein [Sciscionella sp. SE31]
MRRLAVFAAVALLAAGCAPPGAEFAENQPKGKPVSAISTDPAKAGKVTLNVWDQEVRGGQNEQFTQLLEEFQKRYPNVTINRTSKSTDDVRTTLKLALSGNNPPDVAEVNQGYPDMVAFVKAGMLTPLDNYAKVYGWKNRYPKALLGLNSSDRKRFGTGSLYGLSQMGEYVGVFYNKKKLAAAGLEPPKTWQEFTGELDKLKARGELPIQFGNLDREAAIHVFGVLASQFAGREAVRSLILGRGRGSWTDPKIVQAARVLRDWARRGYLTPNGNGLGYDDSAKQFAAGKGVFMITGTWETEVLGAPMGNNLGLIPPPPLQPGAGPATIGGENFALAISSKSRHPDVSAALIDFLTDEHAAKVLTETGNLPAVPGDNAARLPADSPRRAMLDGWDRINAGGGPAPYPDYTTPSFYDTITAALQELVDGRLSPEQFTERLQSDVDKFGQGR